MARAASPDGPVAAGELRLYAIDIRAGDRARLVDGSGLRALLREAARAGGATVLGEEFVDFPNGAVTGVLVLAQSHLSIHTWPERALASVDLLTCGPLRADAVAEVLRDGLAAEAVNTTCVVRDAP